MHANKNLLKKFYTCLQNRDPEGISKCYCPDATFSDPVFTYLQGREVLAMWHMLLERGKDLAVKFADLDASYTIGRGRWEATYTYSGRQVHNLIHSKFTFRDGLILTHEDSFSLWRWSRMALGIPGLVLGWSPPLQKKVRDTAREALSKFIETHPQYQ
jgi:hypothetical protein